MTKAELLEELGIDLKHRKSGKAKLICPRCSDSRRNKKDLCLSVDIDEGLYRCHHCDFHGRVFEKKVKEHVKPVPRLEKVSPKILDWFENERKIGNNTLLRFKISEAREWMPQFEKEVETICFNYFRNEELVNIKFRGPKKSFKMAKDAELIFFNLDAIQGEETAIITEGEVDCLSLHECGIFNSVSVPNGASKGNQKLEYLDNCWEYFEKISKVILAVDNDEAGRRLREELARRIGKEKCFTVDYPAGCKDANEVLVRHGKSEVVQLIENAKQWPLEGIMTMEEIYPIICDWYEHGYPPGAKAQIEGVDEFLTFAPGQLTIGTGIPGHGKDEFFNWIIASLAKHEEWVFGVCGFEEMPAETTTKLIEKFTGKSFGFRKNPDERVSTREFEYGTEMVRKYFHIMNHEEIECSVEGILEIAEMLVTRIGIKGLYISPWNWIELNRPPHLSETEFVSQQLSKIIKFGRRRGVHVFLIAHTTKILKDKKTGKFEIPNLYSISGSANFYNKTHNGITVYKDGNTVDVYYQKVKQSWLGQTGFATFSYNTHTRQYNFLSSSLIQQPIQTALPLNGNGITKWKPINLGLPYKDNDDKDDLPFP